MGDRYKKNYIEPLQKIIDEDGYKAARKLEQKIKRELVKLIKDGEMCTITCIEEFLYKKGYNYEGECFATFEGLSSKPRQAIFFMWNAKALYFLERLLKTKDLYMYMDFSGSRFYKLKSILSSRSVKIRTSNLKLKYTSIHDNWDQGRDKPVWVEFMNRQGYEDYRPQIIINDIGEHLKSLANGKEY